MSGAILDDIVAHKRQELAARQAERPLSALKDAAAAQPPPRGFAAALAARAGQQRPAIIAEVKKASPSKGVIRADFDPLALARGLAAAGATCLSVLTDQRFFQGSDASLTQVRQALPLPVLRKDFTLDPYQVHEARAYGADCILLIASILTPAQMQECQALAAELGMDALVEVHNAAELEAALTVNPTLIGINNRDLKTFKVDLNTTLHLLPRIPPGVQVVAESGIHTPADIHRLAAAGVHAFLIGEALMKAKNPAEALETLLQR